MTKFLSLVPVTAAAVVYAPLLSGYFATDDFINLYSIVNDDTLEYLLRPHGSHLLIARNALFMLFYSLFGVRAELYFTAVLATHLLNVLLVYRIVRSSTASVPLAAFGATLWGTCPVLAGTLEWYSVYGQVIVATVLLVLLDRTARWATARALPPWSALVVWPLLLIVAATSFGNGIALTIVSPIVFYLLLPPSRRRLALCAVLLVLALGTIPAYRALTWWYAELSGVRGGLFVNTMTIAGLDSYRLSILGMLGYLMSYGVTAVLLGFAGHWIHFPGPASAILTGLCTMALLMTLVRASPAVRRQILALLILAAASYGIIAAGRAMYARGDIAASAARARYHYVSSVPIAILLCVLLNQLSLKMRRKEALHGAVLLLWLASAIVLYGRAPSFINLHKPARNEVQQAVATMRATIERAPPRAEVQMHNRPFRSIGPMLPKHADFPGWAALFVITFPANHVDGRPVRFIEDDPATLQAAKAGRRTRDLFAEAQPTDRPRAAPQ